MLTGKYFSYKYVKELIARIGLDMSEIYDSEIVENIGSVLMSLKSSEFFKVIVANGEDGNNPPVDIVDYKGILPQNLVKILSAFNKATGTAMIRETSVIPAMYVDGVFNTTSEVHKFSLVNINDTAYIMVDFPVGKVDLIYTAFVVDEEGYPMVPDNEAVLKACVYYSAELLSRRLYLQDKLSKDKFDLIHKEALFYMALASNEGKAFDRNVAESMVIRQNLISGGGGRYPVFIKGKRRRR